MSFGRRVRGQLAHPKPAVKHTRRSTNNDTYEYVGEVVSLSGL